jgi:phosphatidylglycerophosphate synthase
MARSVGTNKFSRVVPHPFGLANWVTLLRASGAALLLGAAGAAVFAGLALGAAARWTALAAALALLALDGVDGFLARRLGQATAFGARFDMEADALLGLGLSFFVWALGQAGAWVLLSGLMRYIFIIVGWVWPALAAPLPPRRRRRAICVAHISVLTVSLAPPVTTLWSTVICLAGLVLLGYSFGSDAVWLLSRDAIKNEAMVERS